MKFKQRGVDLQYQATSKANANKLFAISCDICCMKGKNIPCDTCEIAVAHSLVIAIFDDMEQERKQVRQMTKKYIIKGMYVEFEVLGECRTTNTAELCYYAVLKGTRQIAWLYEDTVEFVTHKGNIIMPATFEIHAQLSFFHKRGMDQRDNV